MAGALSSVLLKAAALNAVFFFYFLAIFIRIIFSAVFVAAGRYFYTASPEFCGGDSAFCAGAPAAFFGRGACPPALGAGVFFFLLSAGLF